MRSNTRKWKERIMALALALTLVLGSALPQGAAVAKAAGTVDVTFKVSDGQEPIGGASVTVGSQTETTAVNGECVITGLTEGESYSYTVIKDYYQKSESTFTATTSPVNVELNKEVTDITLNPTGNIEVEVGASADITATTSPVAGKVCTWSSNNDSVVTVSNGRITGQSVGTATITAAYGDVQATINVNVKKIATSLSLSAVVEPSSGVDSESVTCSVTGAPAGAYLKYYANDIMFHQGTETSAVYKNENDNLIGDITFKVVYDGDENHEGAEAIATVNGMTRNQKIVFEEGKGETAAKVVTFGEDAKVQFDIPFDKENCVIKGKLSYEVTKWNQDTSKYENSDKLTVTTKEGVASATATEAGLYKIKVTAEKSENYNEGTGELYVYVQDRIVFSDISSKLVKTEGTGNKVYNGESDVVLTAVLAESEINSLNIYTGGLDISGGLTFELSGKVDGKDADTYGELNNIAVTAVKVGEQALGVAVDVKEQDTYSTKIVIEKRPVTIGTMGCEVKNSLTQTTKELVEKETGRATDVSEGADTGFLENEREELLERINVSTKKDFYYEQDNGTTENNHQIIPLLENMSDDYKNYNLKVAEDSKLGDLTVTNMTVTIEEILEKVTLSADKYYQEMKEVGDVSKKGAFYVGAGDIQANVSANKYFDAIYFVESGEKAEGGTENECPVDYVAEGVERSTYVYLVNDGKVCSQLTNLPQLTYYIDKEAPEVSFAAEVHSEATKLDDVLKKMVTFGLYKNESWVLETKVKDKPDENNSGIKSWSYAKYKLEEKDKDSGEYVLPKESDIKEKYEKGEFEFTPIEEKEQYGIPVEKEEDGHYIVLVRVEDNVGNTVIYASNGIVMEVQAPTIKIVEAETNNEIKPGNLYGEDLKYKVIVKDYTDGQKENLDNIVISGVKEYQVTVAEGGKSLPKYSYKEELANTEQLYKLAELKALKYDGTEERTISENSNNLSIGVSAVDQAGNEMEVETPLKIDTKAPIIDIEYNDAKSEEVGGKTYYREDCTMTITYTERNMDQDSIKFDIVKDNEPVHKDVSLEGLEALGITWVNKELTDNQSDKEDTEWTDERTWKLTLKFDKDGEYKITPKCTDFANHSTKEKEQNFVIDKVKPKIEVKYYDNKGGLIKEDDISTDSGNITYKKTPVTAKITIKEENFSTNNTTDSSDIVQADVSGISALDSQGNKVDNKAFKDAIDGMKNPIKWSTQNCTHEYTLFLNFDANYTIGFQYTDLAGNKAVYEPRYLTVDGKAPTGTIKFDENDLWEKFVTTITFGIFKKEPYTVTITSADATSGVKSAKYYKQRFKADAGEKPKSEADLEKLEKDKWTEFNGDCKFFVSPNEQFVVYERIEDKAGNWQYVSSDGAIADNRKPEIEVEILNANNARNEIFAEDVKMRVTVKDPTEGDTYSGIQNLSYRIVASGNVTKETKWIEAFVATDKKQSKEIIIRDITINAQEFNSNKVEVFFKATDFSGNDFDNTVYTGANALKIDKTPPVVESFKWNTNAASNGKYYNTTRTATITVRERNFDPNQIRLNLTNTDGTMPQISNWTVDKSGTSDDNLNICTVTFAADGDYTMSMSCTDLAGNTSNTVTENEFTIDKTVPRLNVSFDNNSVKNGKYYDAARTATITVDEHNFNGSDVNTAITSSTVTPGVHGWSNSGNSHSATVPFTADGDYSFTVNYTDLAGNPAQAYNVDEFTIDQTKPEVEIFDIEDKSANNGEVAPGVRYSDTNHDVNGVSITYSGAKHAEKEVDGARSAIPNGESIKMADFEHTPETDDVYTMVAKVTDLAGNSDEKTVTFSVNRFGSNFLFSEDTEKFLDDYYNNEEEELVVTEINVDTLTHRGITCGHDGDTEDFKEGTEYTVKESGTEVSWKTYEYTIKKNNFEKEGMYNITIDSVDRATNQVNNKIKEADIEFVIDKTAPTVVINGIEDKGQYRTSERDITIATADNMAMDRVELYVDDEKDPTESYNAKTIQREGGELPYTLNSSSDWQEVKAVAIDKAGNVTDTSRPEDGDKEKWLSVLVTSNVFVQFYRNTPLVIGSVVGLAALIGIIFLILAKRRKQEESIEE